MSENNVNSQSVESDLVLHCLIMLVFSSIYVKGKNDAFMPSTVFKSCKIASFSLYSN